MNALNVFSYGISALFFFSLFLFQFYLLPDRFETSTFLTSLLITLPVIIYVFIRVSIVRTQRASYGVYTNTAPILAILIFSVVAVCLFLVDLDSLKITRHAAREESLLIRLLNLHVVLVLFLCIYKYSEKFRGIDKGTLLLFLAVCLSFAIAMLEGRRSSILIPVILVGLFSLINVKSRKDFWTKGLFFLVSFFALFLLVTAIRTPDFTQLEFLLNAVLGRLFNPGNMLLEVIHQNDFTFDPRTLEKSIERLGYVFGLNDYQGTTNSFGIYYGFLSPTNTNVAINPGVITEFYLAFGWFYLVPIILILEFALVVMKLYERLLFRADLFVAVLIVHGMQMEAPYTLGLLVKLYITGILLLLLGILLPKRSIKTYSAEEHVES